MTDSTFTIKQSAKYFFSGTFLSRVSGMGRDITMAYFFGIDPTVAAFLLAFRFSHLMRRLFGEGALQSAFIPKFEEVRLKSEKEAHRFFISLTLILSLTLLLVIGSSSLIVSLVLKAGFISEKNREIVFLTLLMLPSLLFICLYGLNASLLQCNRHFFISSAAPIVFNCIWILSVFVLSYYHLQPEMFYLSLGIIFGCFFQWVFTLPKIYSLIYQEKQFLFTEKLASHFARIQPIFKPLFLGMVGVAATQINTFFDSIFARYAQLEGPAILWFAMRLQQLPLALFGIAIASAILPPLSRAARSKQLERFTYFLRFGLVSAIAIMIPITAIIFCMGDTVINLIYGRGGFNDFAILQTTLCFWGYAVGLLPMTAILILAPACYANNHYLLPVKTSILNIIANTILNFLFIFIFKWGACSVALATSISSWVNFYLLYKNLHLSFLTNQNLFFILKIFLISFFSAATVFLVRFLFGGFVISEEFIIYWPKSFTDKVIHFIQQFGLFAFCGIVGAIFTNLKASDLFLYKTIKAESFLKNYLQ